MVDHLTDADASQSWKCEFPTLTLIDGPSSIAPCFHQSSGGVKTCFWIHHPCIISPWTMTMGQSGFLFRGNVLRMPFIYNLFHHLIRFLTVMPAKIDFVTIHCNFNWFCFDASVCFQHRCLMCNLQEHILSNYCIFQYLWTTSWPLLSAWCLGSCSRSSGPCASSSSAASPTQ